MDLFVFEGILNQDLYEFRLNRICDGVMELRLDSVIHAYILSGSSEGRASEPLET